MISRQHSKQLLHFLKSYKHILKKKYVLIKYVLNLFNETQYIFYLLNKISNSNIFDLKSI